jgi:hypothetical protein
MQEHGSDVARIREQITNDYIAGKLGLDGLALGMGRHSFITKRQENIGALHEQLLSLVGDEAIAIVIEATDAVPETLTRSDILAVFQRELADSVELEPLCNALQEAWNAVDLFDAPVDLLNLAAFAGVNRLRERFGDESARKMIFAPPTAHRDISPS